MIVIVVDDGDQFMRWSSVFRSHLDCFWLGAKSVTRGSSYHWSPYELIFSPWAYSNPNNNRFCDYTINAAKIIFKVIIEMLS